MPTAAAASNSRTDSWQSEHSARCPCKVFCSSSVNSPETERAHSSRNLSCGSISDHPLSGLVALFLMLLFYGHVIPKHLLPQLIEAAVVVVSHVPEGLSRLLA